MNRLNVGQKRCEVIKLLSKWLPYIEKFKTQIKNYNTSPSRIKEESAQLAEQSKEDKKALWNDKKEIAMIQSAMQKYKRKDRSSKRQGMSALICVRLSMPS